MMFSKVDGIIPFINMPNTGTFGSQLPESLTINAVREFPGTTGLPSPPETLGS